MLQLRSTFAPRRTLAAAALLTTAVACGGGGGDGSSVAPKPSATTSSVTVPAQITVAPNAGALSVQIAATYDRASGAPGSLGAQTVTLPGGGAQNVPFKLDLTSCLNDGSRAGGGAATTCNVSLQLTLLGGTTAIDAQTVGPFAVTPGQSATSPAVSFVQIAKIEVGPAPAGGAAASVTLGQTLALTARVLDPSGNAVGGRPVRWSSSAVGVATVDPATGVVTPVAVGSTNITAAVGGVAGSLPVTVTSPTPPSAVTLTVGTNSTGAGGGLVTSAQAGASGAISCHRIGGVTLGANCSTQYASGTQVTLTASPDPLSTFVKWDGCTAVSGATCTVTLGSAAAAPIATFEASPAANGVTIAPTTSSGSGSGSLTITTTVISAPCDRAQVNQANGGTCIAPWNPAYVPAGGAVLTATPAAGSRFTGWLGCPAASGNTCTVPRNGVFAVSASFDP